MKVMRKIIEIDDERCDGCGECVPSCAEGAIEVVDGKARVVAEKYCDGLGACLGECPNGALRIVDREAEDFDEEAVEAYLKEKAEKPVDGPLACGCPSSQIQTFIPESPETETVAGDSPSRGVSSLSHWPVQIRLVPPTAPFLKGADLLVAADCTPVAYPDFHRDFLKGKVVMVGCPKFDDVEGYITKFTEIFKTADIHTITIVVMEVPCCSGLPLIVKRALEASRKEIPMEEVVISARGETLKRKRYKV
ncbi:MAG: 4Fe-4S dicluster domain-containing protein [Pseudomonadota bacterium]